MLKFTLLISFLLFSLIALSSCGSSENISKENSYSPCNDKLYLTLQARDSTSYTQFEKDYFRKKQAECLAFIDKKEHDKKQAAGEKIALGMVIAGGIVAAALLFLVIIGFKQ